MGAALVALLGLALATGLLDGPAAGAVGSPGYLLGLALCLGGSFSYACVTLIAKSVPAVSSLALAGWQCLVGMVALAWWPLRQGWPAAGPAWAWLAGLGVIHTGLAYAVLYGGMARLPAGRIAVLQFVYPAAALATDGWVYGRMPSAVQAAGMGLMGLALLSRHQASMSLAGGTGAADAGCAQVTLQRPPPPTTPPSPPQTPAQ